MSERAYTVAELDALRRAVETRWLFGTTRMRPGPSQSRVYTAEEKDRAVEALMRTHMLAGHTAQDIYDADKERT